MPFQADQSWLSDGKRLADKSRLFRVRAKVYQKSVYQGLFEMDDAYNVDMCRIGLLKLEASLSVVRHTCFHTFVLLQCPSNLPQLSSEPSLDGRERFKERRGPRKSLSGVYNPPVGCRLSRRSWRTGQANCKDP